MRKTNSKNARNVAVPKPVSVNNVVSIARAEIWQRQFNPDYDQVVLRISNVVENGLRYGSPPPTVV